ncbi:hypothetical protein SAMN05421747_101280 [Parapedobacter composti]|uniref:Outer membrane protein beta-barrel domain-containing protein n=1 Tax=Parapedobacter composti TaxID=623281 RepID=A0A1I1E463_9SPHI|nr:outer membrane beta-barrel protein [Parapedobacter composti]SFB81442.1 hypothetical protein SAMN05421747_101280 [Parapedobacter composti]
MEDKHPIDKLFREGLNGPEIPFDETVWNAVAKKLPRKKRKSPLLIWLGSGCAAALVIAIVWLSGDRTGSSNGPALPTARELPTANSAIPQEHTVVPTTGSDSVIARKSTKQLPITAVAESTDEVPHSNGQLLAVEQVNVNVLSTSPLTTSPITELRTNEKTPTGRVAEITNAQMQPSEPQGGWTFSITAAPDLSGIRPFAGKLSRNFGIVMSYRLNDRLNIAGGLLYAKKLYQADFGVYQPEGGWPSYRNGADRIDADCRVLDIPLTIHYKLWQDGQSSWFAAGGLSSYIMLRETYDFHSYRSESFYPRQYRFRNENQHFFGILHMGIGYHRKFNNAMGMTVQPFVKVPLSQIGQGNIKLYSTGVALSVDIDLTRRRP